MLKAHFCVGYRAGRGYFCVGGRDIFEDIYAIVEITIKGSMKSPHLPSRSPQPQPKKNLTAFCGVLDSLLEPHYAECFFILERCGRRRSRLKFVVDEQIWQWPRLMPWHLQGIKLCY